MANLIKAKSSSEVIFLINDLKVVFNESIVTMITARAYRIAIQIFGDHDSQNKGCEQGQVGGHARGRFFSNFGNMANAQKQNEGAKSDNQQPRR